MTDMTLSDLAKKMADIDFCMLSTRTAGGEIAARPMSNNGDVEYDGDSYFFSCGGASQSHTWPSAGRERIVDHSIHPPSYAFTFL